MRKNMKNHIYMCVCVNHFEYNWITLLYTRNWHSIVNWLCFNLKKRWRPGGWPPEGRFTCWRCGRSLESVGELNITLCPVTMNSLTGLGGVGMPESSPQTSSALREVTIYRMLLHLPLVWSWTNYLFSVFLSSLLQSEGNNDKNCRELLWGLGKFM